MKKRLVSTVIVGAAAVAVVLVGSAARATVIRAISIHFVCPCGRDDTGACCPGPDPFTGNCPPCASGGLDPTELTGAPLYLAGNWNIAPGQGGVVTGLTDNVGAVVIGATLLWEATTTSATRVTAPIFFEGSDLKLMSQFLDQDTSTPSPTFIQITGIPVDLAVNYDVVIYTLTTVPNLGGEYAVNGGDPKFVLAGGNGVSNGPDFVEAIGDDPGFGTDDWGNYVVFRGLTGNTVTIAATNSLRGKAPVSGVQIVNAQ